MRGVRGSAADVFERLVASMTASSRSCELRVACSLARLAVAATAASAALRCSAFIATLSSLTYSTHDAVM